MSDAPCYRARRSPTQQPTGRRARGSQARRPSAWACWEPAALASPDAVLPGARIGDLRGGSWRSGAAAARLLVPAPPPASRGSCPYRHRKNEHPGARSPLRPAARALSLASKATQSGWLIGTHMRRSISASVPKGAKSPAIRPFLQYASSSCLPASVIPGRYWLAALCTAASAVSWLAAKAPQSG